MSLRILNPSAIIIKAEGRHTGMLQIDADKAMITDYGGPGDVLTKETLKQQIDLCREKLTSVNRLIESAAAMRNDLRAEEKKLGALNTRVLHSAKGKFGGDANEIQMLGGTRRSGRKRSTKIKVAPNPPLK